MIRQVKHMGQADSTSIGPTSGADVRQGEAGEFGSVDRQYRPQGGGQHARKERGRREARASPSSCAAASVVT